MDSCILCIRILHIIKNEISKGRGKKKIFLRSEQFRTDRIAREDESNARQPSIQAVVACSQFVTGNLRSELIYDLAFRNSVFINP